MYDIKSLLVIGIFSEKQTNNSNNDNNNKNLNGAKKMTRRDSKGLENVVTPNGQLQKYSDVLLL